MTWLRYGTDDIRQQWYLEEQAKCKSIGIRTTLAHEIRGQAFHVDDDTAYRFTNLNHIVDGKSVLAEAQKYHNPNPTFKKNKDFLSTSLITDKLDITSPFIKLATDKKVIATVSRYMGHIPLLAAVELWHSRYYNDKILASQLWHCDWENPKSMKIFVNISDVWEENGPFTFLPADKSKIVRDAVKYTYGEPGYIINDEDMYKHITNKDIVKAIGKETLLFVDSCRCFHYGSRVSQGAAPRILLLIKYLSPASINLLPDIIKKPPYSYLVDKTDDTYSKYVLGYHTQGR